MTLSKEIQLIGLRTMAEYHWKQICDIHKTAAKITGEPDGENGHTADWIDDYFENTGSAADLLARFGEYSPLTPLSEALQADDDYAQSWLANLAMMAHDAGAPLDEANERAADFMSGTFGVRPKYKQNEPESHANKTYQVILADVNSKDIYGHVYDRTALQSIKNYFDIQTQLYVDDQPDKPLPDLSRVGYIITDMTLTASSLIIDVNKLKDNVPSPNEVLFVLVGIGKIGETITHDSGFQKISYIVQ